MKQVLAITVIIISLLTGCGNSVVYIDPQMSDCKYDLRHFDFHYKNETDSPKIIMLGNSLVRWANWDSLLNRKDVLNRGISGDNIKCIASRVSYLKDYDAKICFIEGGINDLPWGEVDSIYMYYLNVITSVQKYELIPVANSILYISPKAGDVWEFRKNYKAINAKIDSINNKIQSYCRLNKIEFININNSLSDQRQLITKYTTDGVHLNGEGYKIWADSINYYLRKYSQ